jgi:uracil-DNA glycosylase
VVKEEKTHLETLLPAAWRASLAEECQQPSFKALDKFLTSERQDGLVYPDDKHLFAALRFTSPRNVRVVILGTEPSCSEGVADGLAFSVHDEAEPGETLLTMFRELKEDLGCRMPITGSLESWARQGVLLLNSILTVRSGRPCSHKDKGWERFTDAILKVVSANRTPTVFVLWGSAAAKKRSLIDQDRHVVLTGEHPGTNPDKFLGSHMFSQINTALELQGHSGIHWQLRYV